MRDTDPDLSVGSPYDSEEQPPLAFDGTQKEAIERCVDISPTNRIVPVTGQAGTGKTTIMRTVHRSLVDAGYTVALCAPTGKAAKRIKEATGIHAVTQHKLLEYPHPGERDPKTGKPLITTEPKRDRFHPLDYDVILGDEYAMTNWELHRNMLDALKKGACLRLFGDVNQLPPIEKNQVVAAQPSPFMEMIDKFKGVRLETIHRQAEGSGIIENGNRIINGRVPKRLDDFTLGMTARPVDAIVQYVREKLEQGIDFSSIEHQIITPSNISWIGTAKLNPVLQNVFQHDVVEGWLELPRHKWARDKHTRIAVNDKVLWTENDYNIQNVHEDGRLMYDENGKERLGVFNGETGIIRSIDFEVEEILIDLGDRHILVPPQIMYETPRGLKTYDPRKSIDLAYCMTTHKSQGSEYKHVVYMLNKAVSFMTNRSNFYTAVTRAREHTHVISDQRTLQMSVSKVYKPREIKQ